MSSCCSSCQAKFRNVSCLFYLHIYVLTFSHDHILSIIAQHFQFEKGQPSNAANHGQAHIIP